jgi:hypothetical protein
MNQYIYTFLEVDVCNLLIKESTKESFHALINIWIAMGKDFYEHMSQKYGKTKLQPGSYLICNSVIFDDKSRPCVKVYKSHFDQACEGEKVPYVSGLTTFFCNRVTKITKDQIHMELVKQSLFKDTSGKFYAQVDDDGDFPRCLTYRTCVINRKKYNMPITAYKGLKSCFWDFQIPCPHKIGNGYLHCAISDGKIENVRMYVIDENNFGNSRMIEQ